jgi:hypothetical protein
MNDLRLQCLLSLKDGYMSFHPLADALKEMIPPRLSSD